MLRTVQNSSFSPSCMMRGFTLIALIFPNVLGLETSDFQRSSRHQ